jgi:diguanylate cyclase (GGDEF)-like protein
MATKPSLWPAGLVAVLILMAGGALVRLGMMQRLAERRASVGSTAMQLANALDQKLGRISAAVDRLSDELTLRNDTSNFQQLAVQGRKELPDDGALFLLPAGERPADNSNTKRFMAEGPALNELKLLQWEPATGDTSREPVLVGPVYMDNGEWTAFVRTPLFFADSSGKQSFWGWTAAAIPIKGLLDSVAWNQLPEAGLDFQFHYLVPSSPTAQIVASSMAAAMDSPVRQSIRSAQGKWWILLAPSDGWIPWTLLIAELLIIAVVALGAWLMISDLLRRPAQLAAEIHSRDRRLRELGQRLATEIGQREELERQFTEATSHDAFTGLPNRTFLIDRLGRALQRSRLEPGYAIAVLVLNIARYKNIIESLGAAVGDQLMTQSVRRIEGCLRPEDLVVARVADDEFATLLFNIGSPQAAAAAATRLIETLSEPFELNSQNVFAPAKIGISLSSSGYEDPEELLQSAHMALSQAAVSNQSQFAMFDPATREQMVTRHQIETDLHQAVERNEFQLYYQPIVSLATGSIVGMEALVRWMHPMEGLLPPERFIPLAEESGLIVRITRWVVREACTQARAWRSKFPADLDFYLSVNLSAQDLKHSDICHFVATELDKAGLPTGVLRLEVTESMMIGNLGAASEIVSQFRTLEIPLLLDDFGTGYSSLGYLNRFQFDYIKIDRAFVNRISGASHNSGIVKTIVHLAQDMGSKTIAEGVETEQIMEQLSMLGCDFGQGYYFSKPVPAAAAEQLLLSRKTWHPANAALSSQNAETSSMR